MEDRGGADWTGWGLVPRRPSKHTLGGWMGLTRPTQDRTSRIYVNCVFTAEERVNDHRQ